MSGAHRRTPARAAPQSTGAGASPNQVQASGPAPGGVDAAPVRRTAAIIVQHMHLMESEMLKSLRILAIGFALHAPFAPALAGTDEGTGTVASKASGVAVKVEGAVKRGAHTAASAVERGVGAAASGVKRAASAVGHGASVAGGAIERTARRIGLPASSASSPN